ncbi:NAD(P)H-binding protein [Mesorhizobium sp. INR15]|uniref:NAD(P)H-binding protein n=1 Tax=Mesorhizobium sp. INR15 TaxID=2654248 RepID=UPI0018968251|nr:NAD(P)H-binding protein [Mesorhizobium sp. INR15]QPC93583.1 NAD(P)H-binding protein [Mesorhizobium sp. INR15]
MILVTGASGYVGGKALAALLRQGLPAVGMVRNVDRRGAGLPAQTPLRVADYDDPASLRRAFDGITTLLFVSSDVTARDMLRHHAHVIEAAVSQKIRSVVFTSIIDIDAQSPFYFTPVYRDAERGLRESGLAWTILRCGLYSDLVLNEWIKPALLTGTLSLPTGAGQIAAISRDDVALALATVATSPIKHAGKIYELTGPESLSLHDFAKVAASALARPLRFIPCSPADFLQRASAEMKDPWPHAYSTLCRSIAEGRYQRATDAYERLTGHSPTSFERFVRDAASD